MMRETSAPDPEVIRARHWRLDMLEATICGRCQAIWPCDAQRLADVVDAQAARLEKRAALEAAARAVCTAQSGAVWVAIADLAAALDAPPRETP